MGKWIREDEDEMVKAFSALGLTIVIALMLWWTVWQIVPHWGEPSAQARAAAAEVQRR